MTTLIESEIKAVKSEKIIGSTELLLFGCNCDAPFDTCNNYDHCMRYRF
jgi:hypothetical protein